MRAILDEIRHQRQTGDLFGSVCLVVCVVLFVVIVASLAVLTMQGLWLLVRDGQWLWLCGIAAVLFLFRWIWKATTP